MGETKPIYAPVPARAIGDRALTAEELRVLAALAAHDRLGANGIGCYASHGRLAVLVGCHIKSLSRSLRTLAERGYIEASQHPLNKRLRVYRVVYTDFDKAYLSARIGNETATDIGNKPVPDADAIGNKPAKKDQLIHSDSDVNIFCEAGIHPVETVERYPVETASLPERGLGNAAPSRNAGASPSPAAHSTRAPLQVQEGKAVGSNLAMLEAAMSAKRPIAGQHWLAWLDSLISDGGGLEYQSSDYQRAYRLFEELGERLEAERVQ